MTNGNRKLTLLWDVPFGNHHHQDATHVLENIHKKEEDEKLIQPGPLRKEKEREGNPRRLVLSTSSTRVQNPGDRIIFHSPKCGSCGG